MKSTIFLVLSIALVTSCTKKDTVPIGVVNMKTIMDKSAWGKKHQQAISKELATREKQWEKSCNEPLKELTDRIEKANKAGNTADAKALASEKNLKLRQCSLLRNRYQAEVEKLNEDYAGKILDKVKDISRRIAEDKKLKLVLSLFRGVVLHADDTVDITDSVIKLLDSGE